MTILTVADQPVFFPSVPISPELDGYIYLAQALCEGEFGANRLLEQQSRVDTITIYSAGWFGYLPLAPVVSVSLVEVRRGVDSWSRSIGLPEWMPLAGGAYSITPDSGRVQISVPADEARITYMAGFDFTQPVLEVQKIKAIAGLVLSHMATKNPGLDSLSVNPATGDATSHNYAKLDDYLKTILLPLKRYIPRSL
ncbi:hypothetical protein H6G89_32540 [Oscillatoria sp. FACHB-1407]|uniref:hypothetical protein n=1 Tax=Oscillatoria sp. FACHB-1407 TaxID=2692847 RepID=UPI001686B702|nr:hypothetical protein [Oscillatoria sp. FACHB-1407]MBD2465718.1 hypothetical protein [Oscillatoria sp. FACHB-1407]